MQWPGNGSQEVCFLRYMQKTLPPVLTRSLWRANNTCYIFFLKNRLCASKLLKTAACITHLAFLQASCNNFFSCVKYFVNKEKLLLKKKKKMWEGGGWGWGRTLALWSSQSNFHSQYFILPFHYMLLWHEVGAKELFVQRYIFYEEFVKLLNMLYFFD